MKFEYSFLPTDIAPNITHRTRGLVTAIPLGPDASLYYVKSVKKDHLFLVTSCYTLSQMSYESND